jgi:hypothetical protein
MGIDKEKLVDLKLKTINKLASDLWGKDLRDAFTISNTICHTLFLYLDQVLELKEELVEPEIVSVSENQASCSDALRDALRYQKMHDIDKEILELRKRVASEEQHRVLNAKRNEELKAKAAFNYLQGK